MNNRIDEYVEEVLQAFYGNLIVFVKECEIIIDRGNIDSLKQFEGIFLCLFKAKLMTNIFKFKGNIPQLVRSFSNDWKKSLDLINQEIMRTFTNFKNGQAILQAALTQLVQYYHRFQKVLAHNSYKHISARNEMLNIHHLMVEIKKYKPTY